MGAKRKASGRAAPTDDSTTGWNDKGGKLGPITTYKDVADSEDEFHMQRDEIMFDDGPDAKRRRKFEEEDALLQPSDEEVLGYDDESAEEEDDDDDDQQMRNATDEEEEAEGWGTSKKDYYNADVIETEVDAQEEEAEARRIQQKKLKKMSAADFGFDEDEWLDAPAAKEDEEKAGVVTEVLKDVEITADMSAEDKMTILRTRYPEFEHLADEFVSLQPLLQDLVAQVEAEGPAKKIGAAKSTTVIKCRALAAYLSSLAMYFAILSSPATDAGSSQLLDPAEIHEHPVMDSILQCRELWTKVKSLKVSIPVELSSEDESMSEEEKPKSKSGGIPAKAGKKSKKRKALEAAASEAATLREERMQRAEKDLAGLSSLLPKSRKSSKKSEPEVFREDDDNSDFGEEENLSAKALAEKAKKKKSLQFYTSHITQKANKRAAAGRDVGGDADLPHKERLRDRQIRLNAEAEARGKKLDEYGRGAARTDLDDQSDDDDAAEASKVRGEENEYYDKVAQVSKQKKQDKVDKYDAIKQAKAENGLVRVVEGELDEDGKRAIGYVIEKNKGLAPKRKKDVRNPRVKKRKKFEEKKKKLGSIKAIYKGGEERGGYSGEKTGIKTGLVKSIKL